MADLTPEQIAELRALALDALVEGWRAETFAAKHGDTTLDALQNTATPVVVLALLDRVAELEAERDNARAWARRWKRVAKKLERLRQPPPQLLRRETRADGVEVRRYVLGGHVLTAEVLGSYLRITRVEAEDEPAMAFTVDAEIAGE